MNSLLKDIVASISLVIGTGGHHSPSSLIGTPAGPL